MQSSGDAGPAPDVAVASPAPPTEEAGAWEAGAEEAAVDSAGLGMALAEAPPAEALADAPPAEALADAPPAEALADAPAAEVLAGVPPAGADDDCTATELDAVLAALVVAEDAELLELLEQPANSRVAAATVAARRNRTDIDASFVTPAERRCAHRSTEYQIVIPTSRDLELETRAG